MCPDLSIRTSAQRCGQSLPTRCDLRETAGRSFARKFDRLVSLQRRAPELLTVARSCAELEEAMTNGHHVILPAVQGGNSIEVLQTVCSLSLKV